MGAGHVFRAHACRAEPLRPVTWCQHLVIRRRSGSGQSGSTQGRSPLMATCRGEERKEKVDMGEHAGRGLAGRMVWAVESPIAAKEGAHRHLHGDGRLQ